MGQIAVIVNPHSRRNRGARSPVDELERIVGRQGSVYRCGDPESLASAAEELASCDLAAVAISGGDGTNSMVLTALRAVWGDRPLPPLAMLRGGTMNTVANGLGIPKGKPASLLARLVADVDAGRPLTTTTRRAMEIGGVDADTSPPRPRRLGFLFGLGVIHGFLDEYYRRGRPYPTPVTAVETLGVAIGSAMVGGPTIRRISERLRASLVVDGEAIEAREFLAIGAGTSPALGLGFRPFHYAQEGAEGFHLLAITCSAPRLAANLPRLHASRGIAPGDGFDRLARELLITTEDAEIPYMVDGDLATATSPLRVALGPEVRVVVGSAAG